MKIYHKNAWICAITFTFILCFYTFSFAQYENIKGVQFINGSIVYGKVIKMNSNEIQIETNDGKIISSKFDDVESLIKEGEEESLKNLSKPWHTWEIGTEISYIQYEETSMMKEKGIMYGIVSSYAYHHYFMSKAELKFAYGQLDYDGATWEGFPLTMTGIPNYMLEIRGLLGYDFVRKTITITPYLGIGFRWLNDNPQEKYFGGYKRISNYLYIPIGLEVITNLGNGWSLGAAGEYDLLLRGEQRSCLSDIDPGFNNIENDQTKGYGVRGSISIAKKYEKIGFLIEPYVKYWSISDSYANPITNYGVPIGYVVFEPKNNSTEMGCKLAVTF